MNILSLVTSSSSPAAAHQEGSKQNHMECISLIKMCLGTWEEKDKSHFAQYALFGSVQYFGRGGDVKTINTRFC